MNRLTTNRTALSRSHRPPSFGSAGRQLTLGMPAPHGVRRHDIDHRSGALIRRSADRTDRARGRREAVCVATAERLALVRNRGRCDARTNA